MTLTDCSLVIPTYHRPFEVIELLEHLACTDDCPGEVIVVDGNPESNRLAKWMNSYDLPFKSVYIRSPAGLTRQRNIGVDASAGEFVFFLDDDCFPDPGYFEAMREAFLPGVGAVAGTLINELNKPVSLRWRARFFLRLVPRGEPGRYYPTATSVPRALMKPFTGTRPTDIFPGAAFACRREVFGRHRFSEFFNGYSQGEDVEMSMRIGRDWKILWCGDARAVHQPAGGGRPGSFSKGRMEVLNRYFIWQRYTPRPSLSCRGRFWADFLFIFFCDLARGQVVHASGVASGAIECLLAPPRYQEPNISYELHDTSYAVGN